MQLPRTGEMSSSMAVLGLVVQQPDTIAGVALRLSETFPRARWSPGAAHSNMPNLAKQGLLRVVQEGREPTLDRYEATPKGVAQFRRWVGRSSSLPPALRDGLQARLEFAELEELSALVETVREAERDCRSEYAAAHGRWKAYTNLGPPSGPAGPERLFKSKLKGIQLMDEVMLWGAQAKRLGHLSRQLEGLLEKANSSFVEQEPNGG
jgi:DNA-binding PadR family transcriptional regulator